jgi:S-adenosylmethionine synthetase
VIERKGVGHPDTLSDALAEELSIKYSRFTLDNYGAVLHHNFDKLAILGGSSRVTFGSSEITSPIRILLNGRASWAFGTETIPVREILEEGVYDFFETHFPDYIEKRDLRIIYELSTKSTPGAVEDFSGTAKNPRHNWFSPETLSDLPELTSLRCNDTSIGCYTPPTTILSRVVLNLENILKSSHINSDGRVGTDIKVMGVQAGSRISITAAVPQIARKVQNIDDFFDFKRDLRLYALQTLHEHFPDTEFELTLNPLDNRETGDIYLTHCGSCIETGDEGVVGRGNRVGGLIRVNRPMTMEGVAGKNPVYHTGKVYCGAAYEIATRLVDNTPSDITVSLIGQRGKALDIPWFISVESDVRYLKQREAEIETVTYNVLENLSEITKKFLKKKIPLF